MKKAIGIFVVLASGLLADEPRLMIDSGGHRGMPTFLAFTRNGKTLISAGEDKMVRIWDIGSGKTIRTILGQVGDGEQGKIYAAALSPDERYLAVGDWLGAHPNYEVIRIHDFQTGEVVAILSGHTNVVYSLAFSGDGRWLASGSGDNSVKIWDASGWKLARTLSGRTDDVNAVAFSPDGRTLVSGSRDKSLRLWDRASGRLLKEMTGHEKVVCTVAFSPDGRYIVSGGDDRVVKVWDGHSGTFVRDLASQGSNISQLAFGPNGRLLLTAGGAGDYVCHIFDAASGRDVTRFSGHTNVVTAAAFSADGGSVATGGGDQNEILVWSPTDATVSRRLAGNGRGVYAVGYARDGKSIALGSMTKFVDRNDRGPLEKTILLDQAQGQPISLGLSVKNPNSFLRASEQVGQVVARPKNGDTTTLQILQAGQVKHELVRDLTSGSRHRSFSLSPDGALTASGGDNGFLTLYSSGTGSQSASCVGHTSDVWAVAFSSDGKTLVSGSDDQTVRLWDVTPSSCRNLLTVFVGNDNEWVAWTAQGYYTSSANGDKYIGWHVNQGLDHAAKFYPAAQFQKQFYRPDIVAEFLRTRDIDLAVKTANERRGGEVRSQPVLTSANIQAWLPPVISISSPARGALTAAGKTLRVQAEIISNTLPIADVKVLLNGTQVGKGESPAAGAMRRPIDLEVDLDEGTNILTIVASNEKAMSEPETRKILYHSGANTEKKPRLIAVAVGISHYDTHSGVSLKYADADAAAIETALKNQLDPQRGLFSDVAIHVLPDDKAKRIDIVRELEWMNREATQRDTRVLFLSGHGAVDKRNNYYFFSHEHDPNSYDVGDIPWDLIVRELTASGKAILFVDSCHAGAVTGNRKDDHAKTLAQIIKETNTDQAAGLVTFASSEGSEESEELDTYKHGAFTQALIEGITRGEADSNGDGVIETGELGDWLVKRVRALTDGRQHAVYQPGPGSSFALFRGKP